MKLRNILSVFTICLFSIAIAQPANDNCSGATAITPDGSCQNGTNASANDDWSGEVGCATPGAPGQHLDVWYSFVATDQQFDITVTDISVGANLEVVLVQPTSQPCTGPWMIMASFCGASPVTGSYTGLVVGNTYYYTISSPQNNTGSFQHCVDNTTPASSSNQDCYGATAVCGNASFSGNSSGAGALTDLFSWNDGCLSGENQTSWYTFTVLTSGTLEMTVSPQNGTDDYDFAVWGPASTCPPITAPLRCSYAAGGGNTGLVNGAGDNSEGAFGNQWVEDINVTAGEVYIMVIDNFSSTTSPFDLNWGGSSTLDCSVVLPISLIAFYGVYKEGIITLHWTTASEINNSHFELERSVDGLEWQTVANISGAGNSTQTLYYAYEDSKFHQDVVNYYRLKQVDYDGAFEYHDIISVDDPEKTAKVIRTYNLMGQPVTDSYSGIVIDLYDDGSTSKRFMNP